MEKAVVGEVEERVRPFTYRRDMTHYNNDTSTVGETDLTGRRTYGHFTTTRKHTGPKAPTVLREESTIRTVETRSVSRNIRIEHSMNSYPRTDLDKLENVDKPFNYKIHKFIDFERDVMYE